jgi:drug/metabolite transporter (DMT)-like permease
MGASAFACADMLGKVALNSGADVLTLMTVRSPIGLVLLYIWLRFSKADKPLTPRARLISLGLGVLFTGNVYWLYKAIEAVEVPVAVLTYFTYPLLTGLGAAATGVETLSWRGAAAALAAFVGLALVLGAHPAGIALAGTLYALAGASCRVATLLIMRATLGDADARLITWHSLLASTVLFALLSLGTWHWQPPLTNAGWLATVLLGVTTAAGILGVFVAAVRIGPFRSALVMNLEPLIVAVGSALLLGEVITPLQALGGAVMILALVAFQIRR